MASLYKLLSNLVKTLTFLSDIANDTYQIKFENLCVINSLQKLQLKLM